MVRFLLDRIVSWLLLKLILFNNEQTRGMFNGTNVQLIKEVQRLSQLVEKLRIDQNTNSNNQVNATIEANVLNAEIITKAVEDTNSKATWDKKSSANLK